MSGNMEKWLPHVSKLGTYSAKKEYVLHVMRMMSTGFGVAVGFLVGGLNVDQHEKFQAIFILGIILVFLFLWLSEIAARKLDGIEQEQTNKSRFRNRQ